MNNTEDGAFVFSYINGGYRSTNLGGVTCFNPSSLCAGALPQKSDIQGYRVVAWYYNNDGMGLSSDSTMRDSFVRTCDDSIKISYGNNILVERAVIWQSFNGASFQLGWNGEGCQNCTVRDSDILHAEWQGNNNEPCQPNDGIINMHYSMGTEGAIYENIAFENIRIDTSVGRLFGLYLDVTQPVTISNLYLINVEARQPLKWFDSNYMPSQFMDVAISNGNSYIYGVYFANVTIDGRKIKGDGDWNMQRYGANGTIENIVYQ